MPIFEYKCAECGEKFEKIVRSSDEQTGCPACQSHNVKRLFSGFAVGGSDNCRNAESCGHSGSHECGSCCCHHEH
ncbi:MAG: zinc ribbon domain-containing protein [Victivallaceae bacterium]|nr:zinc ribbon domain-containing protein [Victivallaceae bacterium]